MNGCEIPGLAPRSNLTVHTCGDVMRTCVSLVSYVADRVPTDSPLPNNHDRLEKSSGLYNGNGRMTNTSTTMTETWKIRTFCVSMAMTTTNVLITDHLIKDDKARGVILSSLLGSIIVPVMLGLPDHESRILKRLFRIVLGCQAFTTLALLGWGPLSTRFSANTLSGVITLCNSGAVTLAGWPFGT